MSDLALALADVRRAHRLLHAYQRRVNDLFGMIASSLEAHGMQFAGWYTVGHQPPPKRSSPFYDGRSAWDLLPSRALAAQFTGSNARGAPLMVHLHVIADTGFEHFDGPGEPDAAAFVAVEDCRSELRWSAWRGDRPRVSFDGVYAALREEYGDAMYDGHDHSVDVPSGRVTYRYESDDLAALATAEALQERVVARMIHALQHTA